MLTHRLLWLTFGKCIFILSKFYVSFAQASSITKAKSYLYKWVYENGCNVKKNSSFTSVSSNSIASIETKYAGCWVKFIYVFQQFQHNEKRKIRLLWIRNVSSQQVLRY